MNCKLCQAALPDLLFDAPAPASSAAAVKLAAARAHVATCAACARELASFEATFSLLDTWKAPAVSPYFDQKLAVRLREEQAAPAAGWFESLRTRLLFNTGRQFRPALVGAMALVLVLGGGGIGVVNFTHPHAPVPVSATVNDLQLLDKNVQAEQQVDQILENSATGQDNNTGSTPPQS
jgi:anti-sigma factor RsiW